MVSPALTFPTGTGATRAGTPRYNWTAATIDGARTAGIPWVVVGMHKPCVSMGALHLRSRCGASSTMLMQKKVDLVLTGHEHIYQRSKQIATSASCAASCPAPTTPAASSTPIQRSPRAPARSSRRSAPVEYPRVTSLLPTREAKLLRDVGRSQCESDLGLLDVTATATRARRALRPSDGRHLHRQLHHRRWRRPESTSRRWRASPTRARCSSCSFDATGSSDPDGTIASYSWTFGDGSTATGASPSHLYAASGNYSVVLTVVDNNGAGATPPRIQSRSSDRSDELARDDFNRTVASGWGTATLGGTWSIAGSRDALQVTGAVGRSPCRPARRARRPSLAVSRRPLPTPRCASPSTRCPPVEACTRRSSDVRWDPPTTPRPHGRSRPDRSRSSSSRPPTVLSNIVLPALHLHGRLPNSIFGCR